MTLSDLIQQTRFESPAHEAVLNVFATEAWLSGRLAAAFADHGVTPSQFNVLRILRGHRPAPMTCSQIGNRLLDRTPDVTRLLARLERAGLVSRCRATHDRRAVEVSITEAGLAVLDRLDVPARDEVAHAARHLSGDELRTLSGLLERLRQDQT